MGLRSAIGTAAVSLAMFVGAASSGAAAEQRLALSSSAADLGAWNAKVEQMLGAGTLTVASTQADTMVSGRKHERLAQLYKRVPIWGGDLVRQMGPQGAISLFGTLHEGIYIDVTPELSARDAEAAVTKLGGSLVGENQGSAAPSLVVLPRPGGTYILAYKMRAMHAAGLTIGVRMYFVDAKSGAVVHSYSDLKTQSVPGAAVGTGTGVLNDRKKVSARTQGSGFVASDALRPAQVLTYDYKGDIDRVISVLVSDTFASFLTSDLATDSDNDWTDGPVVDGHVYSGFTYDYYFKRFGRRGLDNANIAVRSVIHPVRRDDLLNQPPDIQSDFFLNAFYWGSGIMVYGEGLPDGFVIVPSRQKVNYFSGALDIVAHELSHGVTDYTSALIYENESGALNESFSDMIGTAVEFMFQPEKADYLVAEDIFTQGDGAPIFGIRSLQNPTAFGDPDHYSIRFTGPEDNGGVHINSGIPNHVFYLAIEGGVHRLSGAAVQGVGAANREQIEKVIYRAFTFLPAGADFSTARAATIQAARDLYASNAAVERAITQAWTAVGVN